MIEREEIDAQGEALGVHAANVERDYVFGWLLKSIFENRYLAELLVFKGGNCMRKVYFPDTRFSSDLDFSALDRIDQERFQAEINQCCMAAQDACGVVFQIEKNSFQPDYMIDETRQAYKGKVYFQDFYGEQSELSISVRLDVTEFDKLILPAVTLPLIHPYSDAALCTANVRATALEELLANKLKCLLQRRHSVDLYDLVYAAFLARTIEVDLGLVLSTFLRKTIFERNPGSAKLILLGLPMAFFETALEKYLVCPLASRFEFARISDGFRAVLDFIFGDAEHGGGRWGPDPYYPAELRNLILEAGASRQLMRITYHGVERMIEPYALAYKRRKDGHAQEYFYAWDQTGGRSSPPGIKTFLHSDVQNLSLTEDRFDPRYEIELSKAGEAPKRSYFGKPFSGGAGRTRSVHSTSRRSARSNPWTVTYTVQCPYCERRFKRTTRSLVLNPHKDANGYRCHGKRGYLT